MYYINDDCKFCILINNMILPDNYVMVILDVVSYHNNKSKKTC